MSEFKRSLTQGLKMESDRTAQTTSSEEGIRLARSLAEVVDRITFEVNEAVFKLF